MKKFRVTWGDESADVYAENEADAWSGFVLGHEVARAHPNLHPREVTEVTDGDADGTG